MKLLSLGVLAILASPILAAAPDLSLRPIARESELATAVVIPAQRRPVMRPPSEQMVSMAAFGGILAVSGLTQSPRPWARPPAIVQQVMAKRRARRKGAICGNSDIQGERVGHVPAKVRGCGLNDAVSVRAVSGVRLSRPATMNCTTAKALNKWVSKAVIPAFKKHGRVVELRVAAHYACRTRNNRPGARISEHGKGKAIDISAFTMKNGKVITVLGNWKKGKYSKALVAVHRKACGPFGTVLGPRADRHHQDHFHLDTASYRSGPYCR